MASTSLIIRLGASVTGALAGLKSVYGRLDGIVQHSKLLNGIKWAGLAALGGVTTGAALVGKQLVSLGATAEATRMTFQTMLGSVEKGDAMIAELNNFANYTPFSNDEIIKSGKTLLAFGVPAEQTNATLKMLGDAASGSGKAVTELSAIYGKVFAKGKADTEALNQMVEAGIPIIAALGKSSGKTGAEIYDMAAKGEIGADKIASAFQAMTGTGGVYANMMEKQASTTSGMWSTIMGQISAAAANIGESLQPLIQDVLKYIQGWTEELIKFSTDGRAVTLISTIALTAIGLGATLAKVFVSAHAYGVATFRAIGDMGSAVWYGVQGSAMLAFGYVVKGLNHAWEQIKAACTVIGRVANGLVQGVISGVAGLWAGIINLVLKGVNAVIGLLNKIPGVDIKSVEKPSFVKSIEDFAEKAGDEAYAELSKVASGQDFKDAAKNAAEKNKKQDRTIAEGKELTAKSSDNILSALGRFGTAADDVAKASGKIDGFAEAASKRVTDWQASAQDKLAARKNGQLEKKDISVKTSQSKETGKKAKSKDSELDSLAKIGLYNFKGAGLDGLDRKRNGLLTEIRDTLQGIRTTGGSLA